MVLESPKLRIKKDERTITIRLNSENYEKYADKEIISWDFCPTSIDIKKSNSTILHGYLMIEVKE